MLSNVIMPCSYEEAKAKKKKVNFRKETKEELLAVGFVPVLLIITPFLALCVVCR